MAAETAAETAAEIAAALAAGLADDPAVDPAAGEAAAAPAAAPASAPAAASDAPVLFLLRTWARVPLYLLLMKGRVAPDLCCRCIFFSHSVYLCAANKVLGAPRGKQTWDHSSRP